MPEPASPPFPGPSSRALPPFDLQSHISRSRRMSTGSASSDDTDVQGLSALDSSAALILVHDSDEGTPFDFSDEDDDDEDEIDAPSPLFEIRRASIPPLPPTIVFLYLLAPYLKLGAMFLPYTRLPLKYGLPELLIFAVLAAFARHVWYMLARYLRKADIEDVVLDTFARGRGKEKQREILRSLVRAGTGTINVLVATTYLRESVHIIIPQLSQRIVYPFTRLIVTGVFGLGILSLSSSKSLASRRIVYATWLSIVTYIAWLSCISYAHSQAILEVTSSWLRMGTFWQGITTTAFAFTSASTLPLYASLKGTAQPVSTTKTSRSRSFRILSLLSIASAVLLMLPSVLFSAFPNVPSVSLRPLLQDPDPLPTMAPIHIAIAVLNAATLLLGVPSLLVVTPALPIPDRIRRSSRFSVSKSITFVLVVALALVPGPVSGVLSDILLVLAIAGTFSLPAIIHISTHFFKRPLAIVVPQHPGTPLIQTPSGAETPSGHTPRPSMSTATRTVYDELLQRKERALQKRQSRKRIVWDIGVWLLFLLTVAGVVGAVALLVQAW